jgi:benzoate membrane transport protein
LFAATVVALLAALPQALVMAITGVALLATLSNSLTVAVSQDAERDAAIVTFLCTASGMSLFGVGSAFWGLLLGVAVLQWRRRDGGGAG